MFAALAALPKAGCSAPYLYPVLGAALRRLSTASPGGPDLKSVLAAAIPTEQVCGACPGCDPNDLGGVGLFPNPKGL